MKEDWLDNVTEEDLKKFFENSSILRSLGMLEDIEIIVEKDGKTFCEFYYCSFDRDNEILHHLTEYDAWGEVCQTSFSNYDSSEYPPFVITKDLIDWQLMVRKANEGRLIDGKTYDEAFLEHYQALNDEYFNPIINEKQEELVSYINDKIRKNHKLRTIVENNQKYLELGE